MNKGEEIAILKGPYPHQMREIASHYTSVIFWGRINDDGTEQEMRNGSIFFLDCGEGPFAVTANHVYEKYLLGKREDPEIMCQIGNVKFLPEDRLIGRNSALDVSTFRVTQDEIRRDGKVAYTTRRSDWPLPPPQVGKGVFFTGFPRVYRNRIGTNRFEWRSYFAILTADSVSEWQVACQFHREDMIDLFGTGMPPPGEPLGGLSGAPLWTLVQTNIVSWRLAGVICEYNENLEVLFARRVDWLAPDGTLPQ